MGRAGHPLSGLRSGRIPGLGAVPRRVSHYVLRRHRLDSLPAYRTILSVAGGRHGGGHDGAHRRHRPSVRHHLSLDGDYALVLGAPPRPLGAAAAFCFLGQHPRRIFHGLGAAWCLLRRSLVPPPAQATAAGREDSVGGQPGRDSGKRPQPHLLQRGPWAVGLPEQCPPEIAEGVALTRPLAAWLVQRPALCRRRRAALGAPPYAPVGLAALRGVRGLLPDGAAQHDPDRPYRAHRDRELLAGMEASAAAPGGTCSAACPARDRGSEDRRRPGLSIATGRLPISRPP